MRWEFPQWMNAYLPIGAFSSADSVEYFMNLPAGSSYTGSLVAAHVIGAVRLLERLHDEERLK